MAADILADGHHTFARPPEPGSMDGPRQATQRLMVFQAGDRSHDRLHRQRKIAIDASPQVQGVFQAFDPAQATAGRPRPRPAARGDRPPAFGFQPHPCLDAVFTRDDVQPFDVVDRDDQPLVQAEAVGEVFEVLGCRHHHGFTGGVKDQGDRGFLGDLAEAGRHTAGAPDGVLDLHGVRTTRIGVDL